MRRMRWYCRLASALVILVWFGRSPAAPAGDNDADIEAGRDLYGDLCATCHGRDMVNPGLVSFDLRKFPHDDFARFRKSVLNGKGQGMPAWSGQLSDDDMKSLWAYVRSGG